MRNRRSGKEDFITKRRLILRITPIALRVVAFEDIIAYHYRFEKIHPFQDGNGRVGRLILFRECLRNNLLPFIIDEVHKQFYFRGLKEFPNIREYLLDTCRSAQDKYSEWVQYFYPDFQNH